MGSDSTQRNVQRIGEVFQSTLPVWGATAGKPRYKCALRISIHAPRVGSDTWGIAPFQVLCVYFNPRSPCGERRLSRLRPSKSRLFQSTLPVWGATFRHCTPHILLSISIHAPRVGSDLPFRPFSLRSSISIHAPRVGSDSAYSVSDFRQDVFQSTLPVWGATKLYLKIEKRNYISIHAPRVGSDTQSLNKSFIQGAISIHAPRVGSDLSPRSSSATLVLFQSTLPVWGATRL